MDFIISLMLNQRRESKTNEREGEKKEREREGYIMVLCRFRILNRRELDTGMGSNPETDISEIFVLKLMECCK